MLSALLFGLAASSALVIGGVAGALWKPPRPLVAVAFASRVALAGTGGPDAIAAGTVEDDSIAGLGGSDLLAGDPSLFGPGDDLAYTDGTDIIADDCEKIIAGPYPDTWDRNPYQPAPFRG